MTYANLTFARKGINTLIIFVAVAVIAAGQTPSTRIDPAVAALEAEARPLADSENRQDRLDAIAKYQKAIELLLLAQERSRAAHLYNIQGTIYLTLSDYSQQLAAYQKALDLYESAGDANGAALSLMNIGDTLTTTGENERALQYLERAIPKFQASGNKYFESVANWTIAGIYENLGAGEKALKYYIAAERLNPSADGLNSIALAYDRIGNYAEAGAYFRRALRMQLEKHDRFGLSKTYSYLGYHNARRGKYEAALEYFESALKQAGTLARSQVQQHAIASTTLQMGRTHAALRDRPAALRSLNEARTIFSRIGNAEGESDALHSIAAVYADVGEYTKAAAFLHDELVIRRSSSDRPGEAIALDALARTWHSAGNPRLAILFGKQAVNEFQALRTEIKGLSPDVRTSFVRQIEAAYKTLAELLIAQGRLPEAQAVLAMLKEDEVFSYVRRDTSEAGKLGERADLREDERAALAKYERLAEQIGALGVEFGRLQAAKSKLDDGASLPAADEKRYAELSARIEEANKVFQVFLRQLADEFAKRPGVVDNVHENAGLQADLRGWGDGVVSLYTIAGEDRYRVILTTPDIQTDGKSEIKAADLNRKISEFRAAIQNPRTDPRPLGKELYDIIVKPIESQLAGAKARTLLWSLDGTLRYVPLAALWDGKQYFGEKYQNVIITLASRTRLSEEPDGNWKVLGLGVTAARQVAEPNGGKVLNFSALPSVRAELGSIVREEQDAGDPGVISGRQLIDDQFTEQSLADRLAQRFKVVHIASHFSFRPGDMTRSFLLLGDGTALTMNKLKTSPKLRFTGVELLTLSACDTAVGEADATGKEIESFAVIAQQNGAKAVMATLWPVADESTALLMTEFYGIKSREKLTKADALQAAQKAMIAGRIKSVGGTGACRADEFAEGKKAAFKCDPNAPYSHPYFWSPFVLIGNWR